MDLEVGQTMHSFMVLPGCPNPLLGRDLCIKMGAQIHVGPERVEVLVKNGPIHVLTSAPEEEYKLFPQPAPSPSPLLQRFLSEVPKVWAEKKKNTQWDSLDMGPQF